MEQNDRNKIALVLAGGGARGAYQIGAWKAFRESGLDKLISGISGTSIGAVNALLFTLEEYEMAESLWLQLSNSNYRKINRKRIESLTGKYSKSLQKLGLLSAFRIVAEDVFISQLELEQALAHVISTKASAIHQKFHVFSSATWLPSITGRGSSLLETPYIDVPEIRYFAWDSLCASDIIKAVLASAAIPIWYDPVFFHGEYYYDGGLMDNVPIQPLYDYGYRKFVIVYLKRRDNSELREIRRKLKQYGDCRAIHIVPSASFQDDISSMLTLSPALTRQRIQLGYDDAWEQIEKQILQFAKGGV